MTPDLSVVIPTLNEAIEAPTLLADLAAQRGVVLEVVVVDGASEDGTPERCRAATRQTGLACRVLDTPRGRATQLNVGATHARAPDLLFLHADSRLPDVNLLAGGRTTLDAIRTREGHDRVAGHFGLRFQRTRPGHSGAYYFYEAKSRLDRSECVNGDQGFWLSRRFFDELGGYDPSLPFMEDARLARRVLARGRWAALPGQLVTSARRFETEGFGRRQVLNALIRNFDVVGFHEFFPAAAGIYRDQGGTGALDLLPFWKAIHRTLHARGPGVALGYWYRTGRYVARNAWQLALALDCRRNRALGHPPGEGPLDWVRRYDRWVAGALDNPVGHVATAAATAGWFYGSWVHKHLFELTPGKACR